MQDVQLQGQGVNTLSKQINPQFKGTIEEKDITNYSEMLDVIHTNLLESQHFLPEQDRNYEAMIPVSSPQPQGSPAKSFG